MMRIIDCDCGETLQAANDDDLIKIVTKHFADEHGDQLSDDQVRELIDERAYTAADA
jgi:predicted small metal-binding protein